MYALGWLLQVLVFCSARDSSSTVSVLTSDGPIQFRIHADSLTAAKEDTAPITVVPRSIGRDGDDIVTVKWKPSVFNGTAQYVRCIFGDRAGQSAQYVESLGVVVCSTPSLAGSSYYESEHVQLTLEVFDPIQHKIIGPDLVHWL